MLNNMSFQKLEIKFSSLRELQTGTWRGSMPVISLESAKRELRMVMGRSMLKQNDSCAEYYDANIEQQDSSARCFSQA